MRDPAHDQPAAPHYACLETTPIGPLWLAGTVSGLALAGFGADEDRIVRAIQKTFGRKPRIDPSGLETAFTQLSAYFAGERQTFDLALDLSRLTPFHQSVLRVVQNIPFGSVSTYSGIARQLGNKGAARAIGRANATNPLPIIVPCHRVLGNDGRLRGYAGGLERKAWLLKHEGRWLL